MKCAKTLAAALVALAIAAPAWAAPVPEIDSGLAQSALMVLAGGVLMLKGKRR